MPKPIGNARNITGAQEQMEILRTEIADGVISYHRQRVVRDANGVQVGSAGAIETVSAVIADMPPADRASVLKTIDYGDTL